MFDRILVPVDGGDAADAALDHAVDLALDYDAAIDALYVADTNRPSLARIGNQVRDALETEGRDVVDDARTRASERGATVTGEVVQGSPGETILEYAAERDADLIAMGTSGTGGVRRLLSRSVAEHVVRRADAPVLTIRSGDDGPVRAAYPYERILVPTDESAHATAALETAIDVAKRHDAAIHVVSVVDVTGVGSNVQTDAITGQLEENALDAVDEVAATVEAAGLDAVTRVGEGSVHRQIRSYAADNGIDLVAMGRHGRRGTDRRLLGSVTERVLRTAPVPVLTVAGDDDG